MWRIKFCEAAKPEANDKNESCHEISSRYHLRDFGISAVNRRKKKPEVREMWRKPSENKLKPSWHFLLGFRVILTDESVNELWLATYDDHVKTSLFSHRTETWAPKK